MNHTKEGLVLVLLNRVAEESTVDFTIVVNTGGVQPDFPPH